MSDRKWNACSATLTATIVALGLSGCSLNPETPPPGETVPAHRVYHSLLQLQPPTVEPQVETVTMVHRVDFDPGTTEMTPDESARLAAFLAEVNAQEDARIEIEGPRREGGYHDAVTAARIETIAAELTRSGLTAEVPERSTASLTRPEEATVVTVTRSMVIEPDCSVPKTIYGPRPTHVWSCTSAVALGRMVADPLDLERGRTLAPADGEASVKAIQRYRGDAIKGLQEESTN